MNVICVGAGLQVHVPLYDPSSVLQLVVCSAQSKVHKARVLTRAVRSMLTQVPTPSPSPLPQPHCFTSSAAKSCQESRYTFAYASALGIHQWLV